MSLREPGGKESLTVDSHSPVSDLCSVQTFTWDTSVLHHLPVSEKTQLAYVQGRLIAWGLCSSSKKMLRVSTMAISPHPWTPQTLEPVAL